MLGEAQRAGPSTRDSPIRDLVTRDPATRVSEASQIHPRNRGHKDFEASPTPPRKRGSNKAPEDFRTPLNNEAFRAFARSSPLDPAHRNSISHLRHECPLLPEAGSAAVGAVASLTAEAAAGVPTAAVAGTARSDVARAAGPAVSRVIDISWPRSKLRFDRPGRRAEATRAPSPPTQSSCANNSAASPAAAQAGSESARSTPAHFPLPERGVFARGLLFSPFVFSCAAFSRISRTARSFSRPAARLLRMMSSRAQTKIGRPPI